MMKNKLRYTNGWNWLFGALAVYVFIGGYADGIWNAINCVIMITAFFLVGRASLDRELEIMLNRARDEMSRENG